MTARVGPNGAGKTTTKESKAAEKRHKELVKEVMSEYSSDFKIKYSVMVSDIVGPENNEYAYCQNGISSRIKPDGGFIFYKKIHPDCLIGVCEHKNQEAIENACQRAAYYLLFLPDHQVFISTSGPGFSEEMMKSCSTATAKFIALAKFGYIRKGLERGVGFSHNQNEEEFKKTFRDWFEYLIKDVK